MNNYFKKNFIKAKVFRFKSLLRVVYTNRKVSNRIQRDFFETDKLKKIEQIRKFLYKKNIYYQ